jgi:hypothetical protein
MTERDEFENNLLAAGAVFAMLATGQPHGVEAVTVVTDDDGNASNQIEVKFSFMLSPYRLTVERVR